MRVEMESILGGQSRWQAELPRGATTTVHRAGALVDDHPALTRALSRLDPLGDALIAVVAMVVLTVVWAVRLRLRSVRAQRSASSFIDQPMADHDAGRSASRR
jgi:hypothetical protein